ncbi:MAG: threonine synthase [Clostridia bacterium]|nr:threonine synthase [Clostridia bacterium]
MLYQSTRDPARKKYTSAEVIKMGLAPDGGLFVPESIPPLTPDMIDVLCRDDYPVRAAKVLSLYLTDYTCDELLADCTAAYSPESFPGGPAPLVSVHDNVYTLELWHGPTAAFKDMALQIMPRLLSRALVKTGETREALILVATSGDTGKAALEGYKDVDRVRIMVFYPVDGVSRVQKLQMATQTGSNVNVCAIKGNFDDAQTGVKKIFGDKDMAAALNDKGFILSSANSINWGRLAPQIVYYVSAYCDFLNRNVLKMGEPMDVCVPTGNFGNIFAAYLAKRMGLPIRRLICASNRNKILTDFFKTGTYDRNRAFHMTMSPSMDILISSNLERLLWVAAGEEKTAAWMKELSEKGSYTIDGDTLAAVTADFRGYYASEHWTAEEIASYFTCHGYLADTHTAVGLHAAEEYLDKKKNNDGTPLVVDSTASPYKFAADVLASLTKDIGLPKDPLDALDALSALTGTEIPYPLRGLREREVRFTSVIGADEMPAAVLAFCDK